MPFEKVVDGIIRYLDREIFANMNNWQELIARIVVGRISENADAVKEYLTKNGFVRTLNVVDRDGNVDVEAILRDIKREIERKGVLQVEVPLVGKLTFTPADVDVLRDDICRR